jgi:hypothetical protein
MLQLVGSVHVILTELLARFRAYGPEGDLALSQGIANRNNDQADRDRLGIVLRVRIQSGRCWS